jgi:hypothetical protein
MLSGGFRREVWATGDQTVALRYHRPRRRQLVHERMREKSEIEAVVTRNLKPRVPLSDLFGGTDRRVAGRAGAAGQGTKWSIDAFGDSTSSTPRLGSSIE